MSVNAVDLNGNLKRVAGGTLYADSPVGSISPFGGSVIPSGYLLCDGTAVSRTTYAELFAVIGISFGSGDDSTSFNLPDLRETVPVGAGRMTGRSVGAHDVYTVGGFKDDQLQGHWHGDGTTTTVEAQSQANTKGFINILGNQWSNKSTDFTKNTASDGDNGEPRTGSTTHGKQLGVNYIIKAKQVAIPADIQSAIEEQNSYSTEETYTGKRWIDGKPIYRKVFYINNPVINWTRISLNFNDIDWIVKGEYIAKRTNGAVITEFYNHDSDNYEVHLLTENGALSYYCQCSSALSAMSITIEYTKTTD